MKFTYTVYNVNDASEIDLTNIDFESIKHKCTHINEIISNSDDTISRYDFILTNVIGDCILNKEDVRTFINGDSGILFLDCKCDNSQHLLFIAQSLDDKIVELDAIIDDYKRQLSYFESYQ